MKLATNKTTLTNSTIKYQFIKSDDSKLTYAEFINFLSSKDEEFLKTFCEALNNATSELLAYF